MVYLTKNEFAQKQGYDDWEAYLLKNADYVTEDALDDMIEEMSALMNNEIGTDGSDITASKYTTLLRQICYKGVQFMIDEEQARAQSERASIYIPGDYMSERHRARLRQIGLRSLTRKVAKWVF